MTNEKLLTLLKYYHEEKAVPQSYNNTEKMWWSGEKQFYELVERDEKYFDRTKNLLKECIIRNEVSGILADNSIDLNRRTIIFYLDLWHGKWFPYDDLDLINEY